jgi:cell division septum initiation protein DivIVA
MSEMSSKANDTPRQDPKLVTNDLDQADVFLFISSLIDQNSDLASKLEQIDTLMKLAEEQAETARAEAERIIAEAKQIAEQSAQEKVSIAQQQAQGIIKAAEEQANRIIAEARQKAEAAKWQAQEIINAAKEKAEKEALLIRQEAEQLRVKSKTLSEGELKETSGTGSKKSPSDSGSIEVRQAVPLSGQEGKDKDRSSALYDGNVELVIPPPIAPDRLLKLGKQLRHTPQIRVLSLKGSLVQGVRIKLFLRARIPLLNILKSIPEVEKVSGGLKKANETHHIRQISDELSSKSIVVVLKR